MQGSDESNIPSFPEVPISRNAFTPQFLKRIGERDEPVTAGEADMAGPWSVEEIPGAGFGLYRLGEGRARQFQPFAVFRSAFLARLAAAILPGTGRDPAFRLRTEADRGGFAVESGREVVGHLALFDERVIEALHAVESVVRSPEALADLLEAAGAIALERAGAILDSRFPDPAG